LHLLFISFKKKTGLLDAHVHPIQHVDKMIAYVGCFTNGGLGGAYHVNPKLLM
jgi:hypothetical protein